MNFFIEVLSGLIWSSYTQTPPSQVFFWGGGCQDGTQQSWTHVLAWPSCQHVRGQPPTLPKKNLIFSGGLVPRQRQGETRSGEECCSKVVRSRCPWQEEKLQRILSKTVRVNEARPCTSLAQIAKDELFHWSLIWSYLSILHRDPTISSFFLGGGITRVLESITGVSKEY